MTNDSELENATLLTHRTNSSTSADEMPPLNVTYAVFEVLVAVCAVVGNSLVILAFHRERRLRRRTNYYIVSLAAADLLVGLLGIPFAILASVGLPRNLHACLFTVSLLVVLCTISIFCLVAVSVDRYWAILHPMGYSRNVRTKTAIGIIGVCWLAGSLVGFLPLLGWHAKEDIGSEPICLFTKVMDYNYLVFLYFATIIFPALLLAAFYAHIYKVVLKQLRQIVTMNPMPSGATSTRTVGGTGTMLRMLGAAQKREVKATQNLSIIVLFFIVCWFPLYTINCILAFNNKVQVPLTVTNFCIILSHLNSAGNPLLYAYHLRDFRAALKNFLCCLLGGKDKDEDGQLGRSQNALQQHGVNASSRNNSLARPCQQAYSDSPAMHRSIATTANTSRSSIASSVQQPVDREPQPQRRMWTLTEVPSVSEDEPSRAVAQIRTVAGRIGSNGQINSAYIDDAVSYDDDDDVFVSASTHERSNSTVAALEELPFRHCSTISICEETGALMRSTSLKHTPSRRKRMKRSVSLSSAESSDRTESNPRSAQLNHQLIVQAEINNRCVDHDDRTELSPKNGKAGVLRTSRSCNGNGDPADGCEDLRLPSPGGRRLSPLKAVSGFLFGKEGARTHRLKELESEHSVESDEGLQRNGMVAGVDDT